MRSDLKKVIVERPRRGGKWARKQRPAKRVALSVAADEFADGGAAARLQKDKEFRDHLAPLKRLLRKNVGRPWDKVYSEICEFADRRSVQGFHLLDHVDYFVERNCWIEGRKVMSVGRWGGAGEVKGLYVHPKTGILRSTQRSTG